MRALDCILTRCFIFGKSALTTCPKVFCRGDCELKGPDYPLGASEKVANISEVSRCPTLAPEQREQFQPAALLGASTATPRICHIREQLHSWALTHPQVAYTAAVFFAFFFFFFAVRPGFGGGVSSGCFRGLSGWKEFGGFGARGLVGEK